MDSSTSDPPKNPDPEPEAFIPYLRERLVNMCVEDGALDYFQQSRFREFSEIFAAYTHHDFHKELDALKRSYAPFDPDGELKLDDLSAVEMKKHADDVASSVRKFAELANYRELSVEEIQESFEAQSLIPLHTAVDVDEFDHLEVFVRGGDITQTEVKKFPFKKEMVDVEIWRRVLMLIKFRPATDFTDKKKRKALEEMPHEPGKFYAYSYKDVPKKDLEILFPNVRVSMTLMDKLLLGIPGIAGGAFTLFKLAAKFTVIIGAVLFWIGGRELLKQVYKNPDVVNTNTMGAVIALMTIIGMLAALGFKQWDKVKNKRLKFLKDVSEHLFFRNMASNASVFNRMVDSAEEEECKEALLVYYHLLVNPETKFTAASLDKTIEDWMRDKFGTVIDFDIDGPIQNLSRIQGLTASGESKALLSINEGGLIEVPSLEEANHIIDYLWDNAYRHNSADAEEPSAAT